MSTLTAVGLAVLGAGCFACAAVLQHRAVDTVSDVTPSGTLSLRGMRSLIRRPGWLAGLGLAAGGSGLHAMALVLAPLSIVQPVGVLAVPIAVLLSAGHGPDNRRRPRRPAPGVLARVALSVAGVTAFVSLAAGSAVSLPVSGGATLAAGGVVAGIVLVLAALGMSRVGWVRCVACATGGAVAFGLVSALLRTVAQEVTSDGVGITDPTVLATCAGLGAALLAGGWLVQQGFASGPPEVVVACLTVVDPIVAVLLGVVLLGEGAATSPGTWALLGLAAAAAATGALGLARHHPDAVAARSATAGPDVAAGSTTAGPEAYRTAPRREPLLHRR